MTPDISAIARKWAKFVADSPGKREYWTGLFMAVIKEAVEEATASLRAQLEEQRWIPVSEPLPERPGEVLVAASDMDGALDLAMFDGFDVPEGFDCTFRVTHWMPLPAAPQLAQESPLNGKEGK